MTFYWKKESFIHGERDSGHQKAGYENMSKASQIMPAISCSEYPFRESNILRWLSNRVLKLKWSLIILTWLVKKTEMLREVVACHVTQLELGFTSESVGLYISKVGARYYFHFQRN